MNVESTGLKDPASAGDKAVVASYGPHFGEEALLVGRNAQAPSSWALQYAVRLLSEL